MGDAIVIDLGSGFLKAGLSDANEPAHIWPSLVGRPRRRYQYMFPGNPSFTGEEAVNGRKYLSFYYPIDHGHVDDWTLVDELWNHVFLPQHELNPEQHPVLVTQPPSASDLHHQRIIETLFDIYNVPELSLAIQGVLTLYAMGRTTGIAVEIGEGVTQIIPAVEGHQLSDATRRVDCGGQELTLYLQKLLCNNGMPFTTRDDLVWRLDGRHTWFQEYCRVIKESFCYVALDPAAEDLRDDIKATYTFPDGVELRDGTKEIPLGPERFYCPEALFNPSLIEKDHAPLYELIMEVLKKSPIDARSYLLENIVLGGGTTMFQGLQERLYHDLSVVIPSSKQSLLRVIADENRLYASWLGGKIFSEMRESQKDSWVTLQNYQEEGDRVFERFKGI